jgi:uncharacterized protein YndB with AHSA1/START domain
MPVTDVQHDKDNLTLTIVADFAAPVERIWEVYADARQLERVFGPPTYPATFVDHELKPGSRSTYFMTSPEGERFAGVWDLETVEEPTGFTFEDAFADEDFNVKADLPMSKNSYAFAAHGDGTRATYISTFASADDLQKVLDMGVVEGATSAINQLDDLVA